MTFPSKIFFSIIIPTFNSEKVLRECLNSIVEQTFNNYEIILIDGLSTDSTVDIIKEYSLNNPNIHWVSEKDLGIYDAMNKGIKIANGEWVYFLGSDDKLSSNNALQEIFNFEKRAFEVV
jgi:glycosyltransferase involved in cell wall biosynthesis